MKVYRVFKNKIVALAVIGSQPPEKGFNLVGAHIDSQELILSQTRYMRQMKWYF